MSDQFPEYNDVMKPKGKYKPLPKIQEEKKSRHSRLIIVILILIVAFGVGYISYDEYKDYRIVKDTELSESAMQYGAEMIIIEIVNIASTCQQVPLSVDDQVINLINIDCLNFGEQDG